MKPRNIKTMAFRILLCLPVAILAETPVLSPSSLNILSPQYRPNDSEGPDHVKKREYQGTQQIRGRALRENKKSGKLEDENCRFGCSVETTFFSDFVRDQSSRVSTFKI